MGVNRPSKIGKYDIVDVLGKGGMGIVYKANDPFLNRAVAIKMMTTVDYADHPDLLKRFYREAQSTGSLHHRNIVTVYDLGDQDGSPYLVMEYLEGESLDAIISSKRSPTLLTKINIIAEVCEGLSYAHQKGIVHRDIKPGNIMILKDGGVKIVDFGIAHIGDRTVTRTGQLIGSLAYMAPEQINGKQVDARTDIFATGVVLYQLLTNTLPFEGETPAATLLKIIHEPPAPLSTSLHSCPTELEHIILKALAKSQDDRYRSVDDLAFDLSQVREQIQQELLGGYVNEAEELLSRSELVNAKEHVLQILRMDRHNTKAVQLLRVIQQRIQEQEVGEQVRQFRQQAQDALEREQYAPALCLVQKALDLHPTDPELQELRGQVEKAKANAEQLHRVLQRAETAHQQGELDSANQAIEEALAIAPDDPQVKALHRAIQRDWAERVRRRQVTSLIEEARKEIASRHFTLALEALRRAEELDPAAPHLQTLITAASSAREQERRRKELEAVKHSIEEALDQEDFESACRRAGEGLEKFPEDRGLQKLKELADKQRSMAERKRFIDQQLAEARKLMETGRTEEVLQLLQAAQQKVGGDAHLESLLAVVREALERQRSEARKADYVQRAKECLRRKSFGDAIRVLEEAQSDFGENAEFNDLLQFAVEQEEAERRRRIADAAAEKAQAFVQNQEYEKAVELLEAALEQAPDEELRIVLVQARHSATEHAKQIADALSNAESMLQGQRPSEALKYLEAQPASFRRDSKFTQLVEKCKEQAERVQHVDEALERARVCLAREDFEAARAILDECVRTYGRTPELNKVAADIDQRQAQVAAETLRKALDEGRALMNAGEPRAVLDRLSLVGTMVGIVPRALSSEYQALQQKASGEQLRKYKAQIRELLEAGQLSEASAAVRQARTEFAQDRELSSLSKAVDQAVKRRSGAEELLRAAKKQFEESKWIEGGETCSQAAALAERDPIMREDVLSTLTGAANAAAVNDWRGAETLMGQLLKIEPDRTLSSALREKIASAKREEELLACLNDARRLQSEGRARDAFAVVESAISSCDDSRLRELREILQQTIREEEERERQERERQERENYLTRVGEQLRREAVPEERVQILQEALGRYPDAAHLQAELASARTLAEQVGSLAKQAQGHEAAQEYGQAIQSWEAIRKLGAGHAELEPSLARLHRLQEEARSKAKAALVARIQAALDSFDFQSAGTALENATKEFPDDSELQTLLNKLDEGLQQRDNAFKLLAEARKSFIAHDFKQGSDRVTRVIETGGQNPEVRRAAVSTLIDAARSELTSQLPAAEKLLAKAIDLGGESAESEGLREKIESEKRELSIARHLSSVQSLISAGNLESALDEVNRALVEHGNEPRLVKRKGEIESSMRAAAEEQKRRAALAAILDSAGKLRTAGDLQGAMGTIDRGLADFPEQPELLQFKRSLQTDIRESEERARREREQAAAREKREREVRRQQEAKQEKERQRKQQEEERRRKAEARRREQEARERSRAAAEAQSTRSSEEAAVAEHVTSAPSAEVRAERTQTTSQPIRMYIATGAIAALVILGTIFWKSAHKAPASMPVTITSTPNGASVHVAQTNTACVTPQCTLHLPPGTYEVKAELPGYRTATQSLSVSPQGANALSFALTPVTEASRVPPSAAEQPPAGATQAVQRSRLEVRGAEPGAEVLVDKERKGTVSRRGTFSTDVLAGDHQVQLLAKKQSSSIISRRFPPGQAVQLNASDLKQPQAPPQLSSEESDWRNIKDSRNVEDFSRFLSQYPNGQLAPQAQRKLEDLYWERASDSKSLGAYRDYLSRYPAGRYAKQADSEIAKADWQSVENSGDPAALQSFIARSPAGTYHDRAVSKLDDLAWQRVGRNDLTSVRSYLQSFPNGKHAEEARKIADELGRPATVARSPEPHTTTPPAVDEKAAVMQILSRYQKAYQQQDIGELQQIWPGMTGEQMKGVGDFFKHASSVTLSYDLTGQPNIENDHAIVRFNQSLSYILNGKLQRSSAKVVMNLTKLQGVPGNWRIESIR